MAKVGEGMMTWPPVEERGFFRRLNEATGVVCDSRSFEVPFGRNPMVVHPPKRWVSMGFPLPWCLKHPETNSGMLERQVKEVGERPRDTLQAVTEDTEVHTPTRCSKRGPEIPMYG